MSYLLESLTRKVDVDNLILNTIDRVLVLRFGRTSDVVCMQLDEIVSALHSSELCSVNDCEFLSSCFFLDLIILEVCVV